MAKIYNEIIIDMNPESPSFEEVIYEDSFEYSGDMYLCEKKDWSHLTHMIDIDGDGKWDTKVFVKGGYIVVETASSPGFPAEETSSIRVNSWNEGILTKQVLDYTQKQARGKSYKQQNLALKLSEGNYGKVPKFDEGVKTTSEGEETEYGAGTVDVDMFYNEDGTRKKSGTVADSMIEAGAINPETNEPWKPFEKHTLIMQIEEFAPTLEAYDPEKIEAEKEEMQQSYKSDIYGLQQKSAEAGSQMRSVYGGGMGGGMRSSIASKAAIGKEFGTAVDAYELAQDKANISRKGTGETAFDTALENSGLMREGGRVPTKDSFLSFLQSIPDTGVN